MAVFALAWAVARACLQTITGDEADTYLFFAGRGDNLHWFPAANNHVLNTLLMRLFTQIFGPSHLSLRIPALIGAAFYISAAYFLVRMLTRYAWLRWALFVCLVYNPFLFDFLVAARGYGLAVAFLLWAITIAVWTRSEPREPGVILRAAVAISICLGLSFTASFPFAFVNAFAGVLLFWWIARRGSAPEFLAMDSPARLKLLAAITIPGLLAILFVAGSVLRHWPKGQIYDGGTSVQEMLGSILSGSLYKLNPEIVNPWLHPTLAWIGHRLPILLLIFVLLRLATLRWDTNWLLRIAAGLALLVTLTVAAHWIAFRIFGMLMPRGRTALYLIPLATLLAGTIAALPSSSSIATWTRRGLQCTIFALAIYFLLCLRLMYFKEWEWGADVKRVYPVVAYYNHAYCVDEIPVSWLYTGSLNYYRVMSGRESLKPFDETLSWELFPKDKPVYVLHAGLDGPLIEREKLKVVHRSDFTDVVVAVRPEMLTAPPGSCKSTSVPSGDPTTADRP